MNLSDIYERHKLNALIQQSIDQWSLQFNDGNRKHLGASLIGSPCARYLWFVFHWAYIPTFIPRMLRLFQRGHREEEWLFRILRETGWIIHEVDPATGKQWRVDACEGHFSGSLDAIGLPPPSWGITEWMLVECKTNKSGENGRKWDELTKYLLKLGKPLHYAQANTYGYLKGLRYGVYFNTNKDDDRMHIETFEVEPLVGQQQINKAQFVILTPTAPPKIHQNGAHYECKFCDALEICHKGAPLARNCRSCRYSMAVAGKQWWCNGYNMLLNDELIRTGCTSYAELLH